MQRALTKMQTVIIMKKWRYTKMRKLTEDEIMALIMLKYLDEFEDETSTEEELYQKVRKFDSTSVGISDEDFETALNGLAQIGVIDYDEDYLDMEDNEPKCVLTTLGKQVMKGISLIAKFDDNTIKMLVNGTIQGVDFVKKYGKDIFDLVAGAI